MKYEKSDSALYVRKITRGMEKMRAELNEHRYRLERNVERRTEQLLKRIALLESCNATLSGRLASAQEELIVLKQQAAPVPPKKNAEPDDRPVKLYVMNNPKLAGPPLRGRRDEHATAA